jgi:hypothetical protein
LGTDSEKFKLRGYRVWDMVDNDASGRIGPRENALYLLAELEGAFERGGIVWATRDVAHLQERLARLMVRLAEMHSKRHGDTTAACD